MTSNVWYLGNAFLALPACTLILFVLFAAVGILNQPSTFPLAVAIVVAALYFAVKRTSSNLKAIGLAAIFVTSIAVIVYLSSLFFDTSWDGQTYHQETVNYIHEGWNPVWVLRDPLGQVLVPWYNAKGAEYVESAIYSFTGNLESGKSMNAFAAVASLLMSWTFFRTLLENDPRRQSLSIALAAIAAANPVTMVQLASFYVDGTIGSAFLCLISSIGLLLLKANYKSAWIGIICSVLLLTNLKLSAIWLLLTTLFCTILFSLWLWKKPKQSLRLAVISITCGVVALIVGFNPYCMNIWHLLRHPVQIMAMSSNSVVGIDDFAPQNFIKQFPNQWERLVVSNFLVANTSGEVATKSAFDSLYPTQLGKEHPNLRIKEFTNSPPQFSLPFTLEQNELKKFEDCDVLLSGFGPWYGEIALLALFPLAAVLISRRGKIQNQSAAVATFCAATALITALTITSSWWARFIPQLWVLPLFALLAFQIMAEQKKSAAIITYLFCGLFFANIALVVFANWSGNIRDSNEIREQLNLAKQNCLQQQTSVQIYLPAMMTSHPTATTRLAEAHIPFQVTKAPPQKSDQCYRITNLPIFPYTNAATSGTKP